MRSIHTLAFVLAFLAGCAHRSRAPERDPEPPTVEAPSAGPRTDAALAAGPELSKTFRSPPSICFDGALKLCRDRDYRVVDQQPPSAFLGRATSFEFTMTFARTPDNRTRVTLRRTPVNNEEALRFLGQLYDTLLEPRQ